jgi:glycosyltransferase involved in cell wall biosynthesis
MKVLLVTNKVRTYALGFQNAIIPLQSLGHEVVWAADFSDFIGDRDQIPCKTLQIDIFSYPFHSTNIRAYKQLKCIIKDERIEAIQCSTPIGSTLARIAAWRCGVKNVIYSAHGFMFFKGAPLINRTVYKLPEVLLSHVTDTLITINDEDYKASLALKLRGNGKRYMIHGAGINVGVEVNIDKIQKRKEIGLQESDIVVVSAGDLNPNKNNRVIIEAFSFLRNKNIHYAICGTGLLEEDLKQLAKKLGVDKNIHFLGYRKDMPEILASSDIFIMPSFREGVPRSIMEAMDLGLPCIGSKTRGIADLIEEGVGGYLSKPSDAKGFATAISNLADNPELRQKFGNYNRNKVKGYSKEIVREELTAIYKEVLK